MRVQVAIDEQVRELVRSHRPELERLVDEALERELAQLESSLRDRPRSPSPN